MQDQLWSRLIVCLLLLLSLVSCSIWSESESKETSWNFTNPEISTFNSSNFARFALQQRSNENDTGTLSKIDFLFRTSNPNGTQLFAIENNLNETLAIEINSADSFRLRLSWILHDNATNSSSLVTKQFNISATGVASGEWQKLEVSTISGGSVLLNGSQIIDHLPENFSSVFVWDNQTIINLAGSGYQGCLADFILNDDLPLPLHSQSQLIYNASYLLFLESESTLPISPGCRQSPCQCEPNGACIYRQWDLLDQCNCTRGYEPNSYCKMEWNTCENLNETCQNQGKCLNVPGIDNFNCSCPKQYLGSRCQSFDICQSMPCQNEALDCQLTGNIEEPNSVDYNCICAPGFTGKNCTMRVDEPSTGPDTGLIVGITVGIIAILLLAIVAFVAAKIIRDRRRDSGAYRPSNRESAMGNRGTSSRQPDGTAMSAMIRPPIDERLI